MSFRFTSRFTSQKGPDLLKSRAALLAPGPSSPRSSADKIREIRASHSERKRSNCVGTSGMDSRLMDRCTGFLVGPRECSPSTSACKGFVGYSNADPSQVSPLVHGAEMRVAESRAVKLASPQALGL